MQSTNTIRMRKKSEQQSDDKLTKEEKSRLEAISSKGKRGKEVKLILKSVAAFLIVVVVVVLPF